MEKVEYHNAEGYADPTAYHAIKNVMALKRGQIRYIENERPVDGSEMRGTRPGIIVSNDANNRYSGTVEVIYLTTAKKKDLPTHVTIRSTGKLSTAMAEQITTVAVKRVGGLCGELTRNEMQALDAAMLISLGLSSAAQANSNNRDAERAIRLETERNLYRQLYTELMEKVTKEE